MISNLILIVLEADVSVYVECVSVWPERRRRVVTSWRCDVTAAHCLARKHNGAKPDRPDPPLPPALFPSFFFFF